MTQEKIDNFRGEYAFLSNFYEIPVTYEGITYQNNEAAFQAMKCTRNSDRKAFASLSPTEAKKLGRKILLRSDWEDCKVFYMRELVHCKFTQNPKLIEKLLETGEAYLEEGNTWGDRIWGTVEGQGANLLGRILMEEREALRILEKEKEAEKEYSEE